MRALIDLTNFSRRFANASDSIVVAQSFAYTHYWNNDSVTTLQQRSGNPGYIKGKPIITGVLASKDANLLKDDQLTETLTGEDFYISRGIDDFSQFLTIMTTSPGCESTQR